jgi:uncharacterized protein (DUF302 family)
MDDPGLVTVPSSNTVTETLERLEAAIARRGMTIFARIDHAAGAAQAGMALRPIMLVLFGSPKAGTPLMQSNQRAGLDLPLKALIWEDDAGRTQFTYNAPAWIAQRHGLGSSAQPVVTTMTRVLEELAAAATAGPGGDGRDSR